MNILLLTTHLNAGGISRYVVNLAEGLAAQGDNVWIASSGGEWLSKIKNRNIIHKTIPIRTKSVCSIKIALSLLVLKSLIVEKKIDIIHANTRVTQFLGFLLHKLFSLPYVSTFHGFYKTSFFRKLFKFSGCATIAVSESVKKYLVNDLGFNDHRIKVVYNGVDIEEFSGKHQSRQEWGFREEDYLVGILGRISEEKGHFLAVEAIKQLVYRNKNIYLLISGKGKLSDLLKSYIEEAALKEKVKFFDCEANNFLDVLDLLLMPSRKEGFGYSIIEAFIKGVPVIGYDVGGISEIIKDKKNGVLFYNYNSSTLAEKIEGIIADDYLRENIILRAKEDALFFSLQRMTMETEKVYLGVL